MSLINQQFQTLTCDGKDCKNAATYQVFQQGIENKTLEEFPWIRTHRAIQTADGRVFNYCSNLCEISGIEAGNHDPVVKSKIESVQGSGIAEIAKAAAEKRKAELAEQAIKEGKPVTLATT